MSTIQLPERFRHLERFADWCLPHEKDRIARRVTLPFDEIQAFYDAMLPEVTSIVGYLRTRPVEEATPEDENLLFIMQSLVEISAAVEVYGENRVTDGADPRLLSPSYEVVGVRT